ncbi:hypothetical protein O181_075662 [Austropuccinia psidii MF-1]|uniref:Uncharacterized protein n=1 Tax=Austropuccinia psidii MF-1 TaxID=1389203 RepID=A0A9Q3ID36_9BASI|nr:hypothetical protein [Austropuccinia psidii MF-1]
MEATIQSNQMDVDKEEARPNPEVPSLSQERHIWRMPELPPIPQGLKHFQVAAIEIYQCQYKNWFRAAKEEEWEICPRLTHQELSGSGEDHRTLRRMEPPVFQRQGQKDKELVEEPKSFIHRPEEGTGNDSSFGDRSPSGVYQLQTSSRSIQRQAQRTSEEAERSQEPSRQGQRQRKLAQTLPTRVQDPQIGAFSRGQCFQHGQNSNGIHSQVAGKDEQDFSMKIDHVQRAINVEIGKLDSKLTQIKFDINDLKKHDKKYTEWYEITNAKFDSIINACSRIESTCHIQND